MINVTSIDASCAESAERGRDLWSYPLKTPLGTMLVICCPKALHALTFLDTCFVEERLAPLRAFLGAQVVPGEQKGEGALSVFHSIQTELSLYFRGALQVFKTPVCFMGSVFQQKAWQALRKIPYGQTCSYKKQAEVMGCPNAHRAAANANGANHLAIVVPCHRVVRQSGVWEAIGEASSQTVAFDARTERLG
jgi:AraC family transcriptional regulator of adaptative response/methylated-DNA-[protein]-cysteine methyltransferase